jgi:iron complex transport system substrate-binding protein
MRDLDIKVVETDPRTVSDTYSLTRTIGKLVGRKQAAAKLEAKLRRQVKGARKGIHTRPKVLLILGVGRTPFVMLPNSWGGDLVRKAGGRLITAGISNDSGFARISDERILTARPQVIIAIPHANSDDIPKVKKFLEDSPAWEGSPAQKNKRIYVPTDNSLLQAGTDVAQIIRKVRRSYLHN